MITQHSEFVMFEIIFSEHSHITIREQLNWNPSCAVPAVPSLLRNVSASLRPGLKKKLKNLKKLKKTLAFQKRCANIKDVVRSEMRTHTGRLRRRQYAISDKNSRPHSGS